MPEYSPKELRLYIDDLDAVLRRRVVENNLRTVFASEKKRIVSNYLITFYFFHWFIRRVP